MIIKIIIVCIIIIDFSRTSDTTVKKVEYKHIFKGISDTIENVMGCDKFMALS